MFSSQLFSIFIVSVNKHELYLQIYFSCYLFLFFCNRMIHVHDLCCVKCGKTIRRERVWKFRKYLFLRIRVLSNQFECLTQFMWFLWFVRELKRTILLIWLSLFYCVGVSLVWVCNIGKPKEQHKNSLTKKNPKDVHLLNYKIK